MAMANNESSGNRFTTASVWILRLLVGAVFITSGLAKLIDLWGTVFKIEDYAEVWGIDVPRTVIMISGLSLATFEFCAGMLLLTGCYRRVVTWSLALCMLFMLPLSAYIWIADPVSDCGCFGDILVISNSATFWKNVVIFAMIVYLMIHNRKGSSIFKAPIQWLVVTIIVFYSLIVALIGYNIQPMVDFRPFAAGMPLFDEDVESNGIKFIYSKDGEVQEFDIDDLPDEENGWVYAGRTDNNIEKDKTLVAYDPSTGDDVTEEYLTGADSLLLIVIPEPARADLSSTYTINELSDAVVRNGGNVVALLATNERGIDRWKDHSMASYPCLSVDDTQLKQLSRGVMSMVWVTGDTVRWKRTIASISLDDTDAISAGKESMSSLRFDGGGYMVKLSAIMLSILFLLFIFQTAVTKILMKFSPLSKEIAQVENVH